MTSAEIRTIPNSTALPEDAELWRYMRLSALLMLLRGNVYIPTIQDLRKEDPLEATNPCTRTHGYFHSISLADQEWLIAHADKHQKKTIEHCGADQKQKVSTFMQIWDRELVKRRAIWCWHHAKIESMALWHVYAKDGVAIKTTPALMKSAFDPYFVDRGIIAPVHYIDHSHPETLEHHFMRPYLLKQRCYQHESEVRLILPINPDDPDIPRLFPVDAGKLISEVWISPHIHQSEAAEVRRSLIHAWRVRDEWHDNDGDPSVFVSSSKTIIESPLDRMALSECQPTGSTSLGPKNMAPVMIADLGMDEK